MSVYLADSTALALMWRDERAGTRLEGLARAGHLLAWCAPTRDELLFSCSSASEASELLNRVGPALLFLPVRPGAEDLALAIRMQLWHGGQGRGAGLTAVLLAAIAIDHDATVVHDSAAFEAIALAEPRLRHERLLPGEQAQPEANNSQR